MYIVIEIQKTGKQVSTLTYAYENQNEADSKFYAIMSAAAISSVPTHSAMVIDEKCAIYQCATYEHPIIQEGET